MFKYGMIMAGGKGKRLRPLTAAIPKPLLPIGEKPIIQLIIEKMNQSGIKHIFISLNYKKEMIQNFLRDGSRFGVKIQYLEEKKQTGTAGSLVLLPQEVIEPILVSNGDLICDLDFFSFFEMLFSFDFVLTGIQREQRSEFGELFVSESSELLSWEEKPTRTQIINGGIYGISPNALSCLRSQISSGEYLDMPQLYTIMQKHDLKTGVFVHQGEWKDVGRMEDYLELSKRMEEDPDGDLGKK